MKKQTLEERFWPKVIKLFGMNSCFEWVAAKDRAGYGSIGLNGKVISAHRASWIIHNGPIPNGGWVLHKCDNPSCVRPSHLFIGNHKSNMKDKVSKSRQHHPSGSKNGRTKLADMDVIQIRIDHSNGKSTTEIAKEKGIHRHSAWMIVTNKSWKHIKLKEQNANE